MVRAILDTCVLFRPLLCDTLLCLAEEELFAPLWSEDILEELRRNLLRHGIAERAVDHRIGQMTEHFPGALVRGYEPLVEAMATAGSDRHVLAAAVRASADLIVTENVRDFSAPACKPFDVAVSHQDTFLLDLADLDPAAVRRAHPAGLALPSRAPHGWPSSSTHWEAGVTGAAVSPRSVTPGDRVETDMRGSVDPTGVRAWQ